MLGVATLIVVNSVMAGFSTKLKDRLHGLLSDVVIESMGMEGFPDPDEKMARIRAVPFLNDRIEAMTPTMEVFAMLQFRFRGETITRPVRVVGIDPEGRTRVGGFSDNLVNQKGEARPTFELSAEARRHYDETHRFLPTGQVIPLPPRGPGDIPPPEPPPMEVHVPKGIIIGYAIGHYRFKNPKTGKVEDVTTLEPGDDLILTTVSGQRLSPVYDRFTVVDYFKSEMSEYDGNYVFVPLDHLQHIRTMHNRVTGIQIKLKHYEDSQAVVDALHELFPDHTYQVSTWESKQGPLLAAISIEKGLLNLLLFMIIAVAGFGILAIFSMIVVEKTRDIGILKALGASNGGVMNIFLGYGLLLGLVGALLGTTAGLLITHYINDIEVGLSMACSIQIFDRNVYYFDKIPTDIQIPTVILVNMGALAIAVIASVIPAVRAAWLQPVRALRYE
jgi:lipoprotein-releasing system permease protein